MTVAEKFPPNVIPFNGNYFSIVLGIFLGCA